MTLAELLALVGRAWSRLLIYPGGLAALAAVWMIARLGRRQGQPVAAPVGPELALSSVALPWLGLALLPLPLLMPLGRPLDIVVLLALLEWPRLLAAASEGHAGDIRRLAALLNSYPILLASTVLLALGAGSFEPGAMAVAPAGDAPLRTIAAHWLGAAGWLAALPPLLGLGPFASPVPASVALRLGLRLRGAGLGALALLPWAALLSERWLWALPAPAVALAALAWAFDRWTAGQRPLAWAWAALWISAVLLVALVLFSAAALGERLR
jgi:hypothetical protein